MLPGSTRPQSRTRGLPPAASEHAERQRIIDGFKRGIGIVGVVRVEQFNAVDRASTNAVSGHQFLSDKAADIGNLAGPHNLALGFAHGEGSQRLVHRPCKGDLDGIDATHLVCRTISQRSREGAVGIKRPARDSARLGIFEVNEYPTIIAAIGRHGVEAKNGGFAAIRAIRDKRGYVRSETVGGLRVLAFG